MAAPKKYTDTVFRELMDSPYGSYDDLSIAYKLIRSLVELRNDKKWTQEILAQNAEISRSQLARFEAGRSNPTLYNLLKITRALGVEIKFEPSDLNPKLADFN